MTLSTHAVIAKKKLIEVALPLDAINAAASAEKNNPFLKGHPRSLHLWWAPRPLAAARAMIFAQMVDDPSANPDLFPTPKKQERERDRLFQIIEDLVKWDNVTNKEVLDRARNEIWQSWRRACAENAQHPSSEDLFNRYVLPSFHDPFAGGAAIPLEAQRLGLKSHAADLNPVAVLINKAKIEIPQKFATNTAVHPQACQAGLLTNGLSEGSSGLMEDIRYYGRYMRDEAKRQIGHLYPRVTVTGKIAATRPDLVSYREKALTVRAWLWARTVRSPNPAFSECDVPLVSTFVLSKRTGKEAYVEPVVSGNRYHFIVKKGDLPESASKGTKVGRASFRCLMSGSPITPAYIKAEGKAGRMGARLMAIVAEGSGEKVYLPPTLEHETIAEGAQRHDWLPTGAVPARLTGGTCVPYGLEEWWQLFTPRQLSALTTFADLISDVRERVRLDAEASGMPSDGISLSENGSGADAYADAIAVYLGISLSKLTDYSSTISTWNSSNENIRNTFPRQALPMTWDFAEASLLHHGMSFGSISDTVARSLEKLPTFGDQGIVAQEDCAARTHSRISHVIQTDPPYYDNISYADLSDFFYVWLRRSLRRILPTLFATVAAPKSEELVVLPGRHGSQREARDHFLHGMTQAMGNLSSECHPAFPIIIYYAVKQSESATSGNIGTGWETFLDAAIRAGLGISGTWPVRTERRKRSVAIGTNALASSIVIVCRPRAIDAPSISRREFQDGLRRELPDALERLRQGNIAPVDLAQASIGPGMEIFSRYRQVLNADGSAMSVGDALGLINATLDEVFLEHVGDFDSDTLWALTWFEEHGFAEGEFGSAEQLSKAKNTSVQGLVQAGLISSNRGIVRLLNPSELDSDWDPATDSRLTIWETTHHLIRALSVSETAAAEVAAKVGSASQAARDLSYRLYTVSERKRRASEAVHYNSLVQSWPEIARLAREQSGVLQPSLLGEIGDSP